ncbi:MAG: response regulator transcription factor [Leptolyngbya sp. Prado105]|jgi:DNA-binding NarL/FixJ family response regulator|nr:response regulator transcription factor [Leptolyngbya sp. Prado105]
MINQAFQGARILLVDDDPSCTALLTEFFEIQGYEIEVAENGEKAIEVLSEDPPDLIVTDVIMPRMDGFALLEEVRSNIETNWIPLIFLTAKSLSNDRIQALSSGANAYIVKPFRLNELSAQVESLLCSSHHLRQNTLKQAEQRIQVPTGIKLTNAELSVAKLVAKGLSNLEISQQLVTSKRTVESHISHMLRKTELSNRTELSRWILENGLA